MAQGTNSPSTAGRRNSGTDVAAPNGNGSRGEQGPRGEKGLPGQPGESGRRITEPVTIAFGSPNRVSVAGRHQDGHD